MMDSITMILGPTECYYDKPLNDRTILKINMLQNVAKYINAEAKLSLRKEDLEGLEQLLYTFMGGAKSDEELQEAVSHLCSQVPGFIDYIIYCDGFSDKALKGWLRYILPIRKRLNQDLARIRTILNSVRRSRFCAWVNDTLYYSVPLGTRVDLELDIEYIE